MPEQTAAATWNGSATDGDGRVDLASGAWNGPYSRPDVEDVTDPEELLAAAHASCFAMTAAFVLAQRGHDPETVRTESVVALDREGGDFSIPSIETTVTGDVPDATDEAFAAAVEAAEDACPVSTALAEPEIEVSVAGAD